MKFSIVISLFYISIALSCDAGINTQRSNSLDPNSPFYAPIFILLEAKTSTIDNTIQLTWINRASRVDGFLVEKRFNTEDIFFPIDTTTVESIVDSTRELSLNLQYKVSSFLIVKGKIDPRYSLILSEPLDYGEIKKISTFTESDSIFIQWFSKTHFDDQIVIEYKLPTDIDWSHLETITNPDSEFYRAGIEKTINESYDFRITLYLENYKGELEAFDQKVYSYN